MKKESIRLKKNIHNYLMLKSYLNLELLTKFNNKNYNL